MISLGDLNTMSLASDIDYQQQNFMEKAANTTFAAVVDVGTSLWNSLIPEATGMEVSTRSILQGMSADGSLAAYDANRDTVQAMSFVAGIFIPGGAALKLARGVRAGLKGTNFLSNSRRVEDLATYEKLIADGAQGTAEYKRVRTAMMLRGQTNNMIDMAASELAIMGAFNAHPYMENYLDNPVKNFAISMAIGGSIGAGLTALVSKSELGAIASRYQSEAIDTVSKEAKLFDTAFSDTATTMTQLKFAAGNLDQLASPAMGMNKLTQNTASEMAASIRVRMGELATSKLSTEIVGLDTVAKNAIADRFTDVRFIGVDRAKFYQPITLGEFTPKGGVATSPTPIFKTKAPTAADEDKFYRNSFYIPERDAFVADKLTANLMTTAADVATPATIASLTKRFTLMENGNKFKAKSLTLERTGDIEAEYLAGLQYYKGLKPEQLVKAEIHADDFPAINGWLSAVQNRSATLKTILQDSTTPVEAGVKAADELMALNNSSIRLHTVDAAGKKVVETIDSQGLYLHNLNAKAKAIDEAVKGGMTQEVAAIKYNIDADMVPIALSNPDNFAQMAANVGFDQANAKLNRWHSAEQVPEALASTRRIMHLTAKKQQIVGQTGDLLDSQREALRGQLILDPQMKAALNAGDTAAAERIRGKLNIIDDQYGAINQLWLEASVTAGKSGTAAAIMADVLQAGEYKVLRQGLSEFNNAKGGNPLFQSADMVTSRMGDIGKLVTALGDKRVHAANLIERQYLDPVATQFRALHSDQVARTEFALFDNIRLSKGGLVRYDSEARTMVTGKIDPKTGNLKDVTPVTDQVVKSEATHQALIALEKAAAELYETQAVVNRLSGKAAPSNTGLWLPYTSLRNKESAFVMNLDNNTQKLLVADTYDELQDLIAKYQPQANEVVRRRSEISAERLALMQDDLETVTKANVGMQKKGIGLANPDLSPQRLTEIIEGFRDRINAQSSAIVEYGSFDLIKKLDYLSEQARKPITDSPKTGFFATVKEAQVKDTAADIKDILLGRSPANRSELIKSFSKPVDTAIQFGIEGVSRAFNIARSVVAKDTAEINWAKYEEARKASNIPDPFANFNDLAKPQLLQRAKDAGYKSDPNRIIRAGNEMATVMALKFGEIAQPLVNMLSLPIMSVSTISRAIKGAEIQTAGQALNGNSLSIMMNGVRRATSNTAENTRLFALADEEGLLTPMLSEVDQVMKMSRFSTGPIAGIEKAMDSSFVKMMSKPSELGEGLVRKAAFGTGVELAKRIYGSNISDRQTLIYARDYMKQALGNYSTAQRPMMFQGSLGAAMGLFQTYMLTYAQNMYRHLDMKDYKGLGKVMLTQGGIFGAGSLPGFHPISETIGEHFSDENYDLQTGTYRAIDDDLASVLLYGLPSNLGPAVHTRGDVAPRIPTGFSTMVAPSMIGQTIGSMVEVGKSMMTVDKNVGQAFFEALSTQSVSRPIARLSELASGYSVTGPGNQIAGPEEVHSFQGILARVFSTRPLSESKVRESIHLNSYYGTIDKESRAAVLERMRTAIRGDRLTDDLLDELATTYLRTGSPQGFRQVVNQAVMEGSEEGMINLSNRFGDSPLMLMVDDLD